MCLYVHALHIAGVKKKPGFLTGMKKESIFKAPEGSHAKVGFTGSGQGMTEYQKRKRHEFRADEGEGF
jgi:survival of motor neuron-related-splicing factor 30